MSIFLSAVGLGHGIRDGSLVRQLERLIANFPALAIDGPAGRKANK